ncbi:hypothetical protein Zmor_003066 [Zophobas morio]|uniref:Reverse transcriptase domain-containing protein n=1 Tax=Zophobas morio TaxID=2755281 RepID=A0AA38M0W2_9CUCU|nr:hypothetical protein Zmor_003066 [Zophobas morio]
MAVTTTPKLVLAIMNDLARKEVFPSKSGSPDPKRGTYRPMFLLNCMSKLLEHMLVSPQQFDFRPGRSTSDAIKEILQIRGGLKAKNISKYLVKFIQSYFEGKNICIDNIELDIRAGVPQDSVLGPLLCIVFYDDLLRLKILRVTQVCFADDLVLVSGTAETQNTLKYIVNKALDMVIRKMELAVEKTKGLILYGPRKRDTVSFKIRNTEISPRKELKYLGVVLGNKGTFGAHIRYATDKAEKSIAALGKLMPDGGPTGRTRKILLNGVANSVTLYGVPIRYEACEIAKHRERLLSTQRKSRALMALHLQRHSRLYPRSPP